MNNRIIAGAALTAFLAYQIKATIDIYKLKKEYDKCSDEWLAETVESFKKMRDAGTITAEEYDHVINSLN